jgi:hypothetical protein
MISEPESEPTQLAEPLHRDRRSCAQLARPCIGRSPKLRVARSHALGSQKAWRDHHPLAILCKR